MPERSERRPYIAGNWKMHKLRAEAREYVDSLLPLIEARDAVEIGICVPFTALDVCVAAADGSALRVLAQNMHEDEHGAYTGEVSASMLVDVGAHGVVLGHSERRLYFGETDKALQRKLPAALAAGLEPILCVGETEEERDGDETERRLRHQVQEAFEDVADSEVTRVVIAYEPVWAIGTGKVATPEQAQEAIAFIRALVRDKYGDLADEVRIQYGGSVNEDNAAELLALSDVDGALVGGASLDPEKLAAIVAAAPA
jgi:triosephosphate isomerase